MGISSKDLQQEIPGAYYCATLPEVTQLLRDLIHEIYRIIQNEIDPNMMWQ